MTNIGIEWVNLVKSSFECDWQSNATDNKQKSNVMHYNILLKLILNPNEKILD
jgi:hypothetical protein